MLAMAELVARFSPSTWTLILENAAKLSITTNPKPNPPEPPELVEQSLGPSSLKYFKIKKPLQTQVGSLSMSLMRTLRTLRCLSLKLQRIRTPSLKTSIAIVLPSRFLSLLGSPNQFSFAAALNGHMWMLGKVSWWTDRELDTTTSPYRTTRRWASQASGNETAQKPQSGLGITR